MRFVHFLQVNHDISDKFLTEWNKFKQLSQIKIITKMKHHEFYIFITKNYMI